MEDMDAGATFHTHEDANVALVGVRKPSEMEENLKAVDWQMTPEDREELRSVVLG
jgi:aryl-alcohol dehydrogenase-like predicted oxidoreductase